MQFVFCISQLIHWILKYIRYILPSAGRGKPAHRERRNKTKNSQICITKTSIFETWCIENWGNKFISIKKKYLKRMTSLPASVEKRLEFLEPCPDWLFPLCRLIFDFRSILNRDTFSLWRQGSIPIKATGQYLDRVIFSTDGLLKMKCWKEKDAMQATAKLTKSKI